MTQTEAGISHFQLQFSLRLSVFEIMR